MPTWRWAAVLACALWAASWPAQAAELSADERLQAVRHALAQEALRGATQVRTTAWIDAQGALRESSSFRSGMQVRGVRVMAYSRDAQGQPQARLQVQGSQDDLVKADAAAPPAAPCPKTDALRHVLGLEVHLRGRWSVDDEHLQREAVQLMGAAWRGAADGRWQLIDVAAAQTQASSSSAYERLLTGAGAASAALNWRLLLSLETVPAAAARSWLPWPTTEPTWMRLTLTLQSARESKPALQRTVDLPLLAQERSWAPPRLQAVSRSQLQTLVQDWSKAIGERLACEPVGVQVLHAAGEQVHIDQGSLAGVQAGDEWLVSDRRRWPARVLESDAPLALVLARVEQVSAHQAQLRVLAGPSASVKPQWQAWPMQSR
jgi:hypothetical protein